MRLSGQQNLSTQSGIHKLSSVDSTPDDVTVYS